MRALRVLGLAVVAGVVTVTTAFGYGPLGNSDASTEVRATRLSARGATVELPEADVRTARLRDGGFSRLVRLQQRAGRGFYRVEFGAGRACYATGSVDSAWPLGVIMCSRGGKAFPSAATPVLDTSIVEGTPGEAPHFVRVQGFAADGVAQILLRNASGRDVGRVEVVDNVYLELAPPADVATLIAVDESGREIASIP